MRYVALALVAWAAPLAAQSDADLPGWMAGCWEMREGERWAEECWTIPRGGQMIGSGRTGSGETLFSFEHMRLEPGEGGALTFLASPGGRGWTAFVSAADPGGGVTFLNPEHDYPQRVRYWREGRELKARISRMDGSDAAEWSYVPMGG